MDGTRERKIEIFAPFSAALDLTKLILFQPFDIGKWFIIGFAAFLAHLAGGGGGGGWNWGNRFNRGNFNWNVRSTTNDVLQSAMPENLTGCVIAAIVVGVVLFFAFIVVMLWIGSRGKFIFIDCIVRNRGAIVEPWHEFRREGNSYFVFTLVLGFAVLVVLAIASIPIWLPFVFGAHDLHGPAFVIGLIAFACLTIGAALGVAIPATFMVPIMYRQRCNALMAYKRAVSMIMTAPGAVILYFLFRFVLGIAFAMVACLATCLTCCIAAIPYLGTVLLLPFYVFFASYLLFFVRQFGTEFDVWGKLLREAALPSAPAPGAAVDVPPTQP